MSIAFRSLHYFEQELIPELKQTFEKLLIQNNKVIPLTGLMRDFGSMAVYTIGILEREKKIFRVPCTDYYMRLENIEFLPLNHHCNLNTLRPNEYALVQSIEAELIVRTALKIKDETDAKIYRKIISNLPFAAAKVITDGAFGGDLANIDETKLLNHFDDLGFISENTVFKNINNDKFLNALYSLEAQRKIARVSGSRHYVVYVPNMGGENNFVTKFEGASLNEQGVKSVLDIESVCAYNILKIDCEVVPMLDTILVEQFLKNIVFE